MRATWFTEQRRLLFSRKEILCLSTLLFHLSLPPIEHHSRAFAYWKHFPCSVTRRADVNILIACCSKKLSSRGIEKLRGVMPWRSWALQNGGDSCFVIIQSQQRLRQSQRFPSYKAQQSLVISNKKLSSNWNLISSWLECCKTLLHSVWTFL